MQSATNKKPLIIAAIITVLILGLAIYFAFRPGHKSSSSDNRYTDKFSHEVVSSPTGKQPDTYGRPGNTPLYLGFDKLLNFGLTSDQLTLLKNAFYSFSSKQSAPFKQISIGVDNINSGHDDSNPSSPFYIKFNFQVDQKKIYAATAQHAGLDDVRLLVYDGAKSVYDSGSLYVPSADNE